MGGLYSPPFGGKIAKFPGDKLTMSTRAALNTYLLDGNTVANYQPGNYTGTTNATAWANSIGAAPSLSGHGTGGGPTINADGSLTFNGTDQYMKMATTLVQPETIILVTKPISWTASHYLFDGASGVASGSVVDVISSPQIQMSAGAGAARNSNLAVGAYGILVATFNGASSYLQVNNTAQTTGDAGAKNMSGLTLSAIQNLAGFGNQQVKEIIIRNVADSAATQASIRTLLKALYNTP